MRRSSGRSRLHASHVTVVPESAVPRVHSSRVAPSPDRSRRTMWIAAVIGIPASAVFLFLAIRGADLGLVWQTLKDVRWGPVAVAVGCMGVVYWLQANRWKRIAATRATQFQFVEMVV